MMAAMMRLATAAIRCKLCACLMVSAPNEYIFSSSSGVAVDAGHYWCGFGSGRCVALIASVTVFHQALQYKTWARVDATVVSVSHTTDTIRNSVGGVSLVDLYAPTLQFVIAGQAQTFTGDYTATHYEVGQVVGVVIKPGDPSTVLLQPPPENYALVVVFAGLGLVGMVLGGCLLLPRRNRSRLPAEV